MKNIQASAPLPPRGWQGPKLSVAQKPSSHAEFSLMTCVRKSRWHFFSSAFCSLPPITIESKENVEVPSTKWGATVWFSLCSNDSFGEFLFLFWSLVITSSILKWPSWSLVYSVTRNAVKQNHGHGMVWARTTAVFLMYNSFGYCFLQNSRHDEGVSELQLNWKLISSAFNISSNRSLRENN